MLFTQHLKIDSMHKADRFLKVKLYLRKRSSRKQLLLKFAAIFSYAADPKSKQPQRILNWN